MANGQHVEKQQPLIAYVKRADGEFYTISEVARMCHRSVDRVRDWVKQGKVEGASHKMTLSETAFVWLYTPEDVARIVAYSKSIRTGRPKKQDNI